jgi:hypothetical protein
MMLSFGFQIHLVRLFGRQIIAKPTGFLVDCDAGSPLVLKPNHTKKSRFVAPVGSANILRIAVSLNNSQIAQSIVPFAPIYMVDNAVRPDAMRVQPSKSVRFVDFLLDAYRDVAKFVCYASRVADVDGFGRSNNPSKNPGFVVVMKKLTNFFSRDAVNHASFPFVRHNVNAGIIA